MHTRQEEQITFTREQFYEKVWSAPTTRVAKELGLSDVMIAKICKSYDIPKPYLGYWAKLEHGKKPRKTPLPRNDDSQVQVLTFYKRHHRETSTSEPPAEPVYDPDIQQILDRARTMKPVKVPSQLRNPHPLVAATRDQIKADQVPFDELACANWNDRRPTLCVHVDKANTARALRIMDALIKRIEKIGGSVGVEEYERNRYRARTVINFGGEDVCVVRLREKHNQIRVPPEEKEYAWESDTELRPSGLLIFDQGPSYFNCILLRDTPKRRRIEDGLNDMIIDLVRQAGDLRIRRRKEQETRRREEEEAQIRREKEEELRRRREELAQRQKAEQDRVDELVHHANSWRQSKIIREYLGAVCDMLSERDGRIRTDSEVAQYLQWAHQQANRFDPLQPSPPSVLDEHT